MVSIAPNQFKIEGTVEKKQPDNQLENFVTVTIRLKSVEHLQGPGEFLDSSAEEIDLSVAEAIAASLHEGLFLSCRVRKAPGHFFIIPDSIKTNDSA